MPDCRWSKRLKELACIVLGIILGLAIYGYRWAYVRGWSDAVDAVSHAASMRPAEIKPKN